MVPVTRLHHIGIYVSNLSTAMRFYHDSLGLPVVYEGPRVRLLAAGDNHVELIEPGAESPLRRRPAMEWEGTNHVAFETPDLAAALTELSRRGIALRDESARSLPAAAPNGPFSRIMNWPRRMNCGSRPTAVRNQPGRRRPNASRCRSRWPPKPGRPATIFLRCRHCLR